MHHGRVWDGDWRLRLSGSLGCTCCSFPSWLLKVIAMIATSLKPTSRSRKTKTQSDSASQLLAQELVERRNPPLNKSISARPALSIRKRAAALLEREIEYIPNEKFAGFDPHETLGEHVVSALDAENQAASVKKRVASELGTPLARACEMPLLTAKQERALFERMNHLKFIAVQRREALDADRPSEALVEEAEQALEEAETIRNRIVGANVRLVISIVKTFADAKNPFDELASEGILSMMHAVEKFDYDRGFRFSTYATRAIRRNLYRLLVQRQKDRTRWSNPTTDLALELSDERNQSAISEQRWTELQYHLKRMLQQLDPRERQIVRARFGMEKSGKVQTLQALARSLGVCKERVRQLEKRAIEKLQKMVTDVKIEEPTA